MADIEASLSVKVQFCEVAKKLNDEKTKCDVKERKKERRRCDFFIKFSPEVPSRRQQQQ